MTQKKTEYEPPAVKDLDAPTGELEPEELAKVSGGGEGDNCGNGTSASQICQAGSGAAIKYPA